jgi:hypothetical protein
MHVYWLLPDKEMNNGLAMLHDADIVHMINASEKHKELDLFIDHSNFVSILRPGSIVNPSTGLAAGSVTIGTVSTNVVYSGSATAAASCYILARGSNGDSSGSGSVAAGSPSLMAAGGSTEDGNDPGFRRTSPRRSTDAHFSDSLDKVEQESDSDTDFEFYDSDFAADSGDDDLFQDNVDTEVNDNNEKVLVVEHEDDGGIDDDDLKLAEEERQKLMYKFKSFNPDVDMENPIFLQQLFQLLQQLCLLHFDLLHQHMILSFSSCTSCISTCFSFFTSSTSLQPHCIPSA